MKKTILIITIFLLTAIPASAQLVNTDDMASVTQTVATSGNLSKVSVGSFVATIISTILGLLAIVFLVLTITAGIKWMTAEGNQEVISKSKQTLVSAIIGLIIVLSAYAITYFIFHALPFSLSGGMPNPQVSS